MWLVAPPQRRRILEQIGRKRCREFSERDWLPNGGQPHVERPAGRIPVRHAALGGSGPSEFAPARGLVSPLPRYWLGLLSEPEPLADLETPSVGGKGRTERGRCTL